MAENSDSRFVCPNCQNEVRMEANALGQISHAVRLRLDTFGTQVNCPHCGQPFVLRANHSDICRVDQIQSPQPLKAPGSFSVRGMHDAATHHPSR